MTDETEPAPVEAGVGDSAAPEAGAPAEFDVDAGPAEGRLTEAQLEALLFVAERPLTRREIATIAGVDRATVDARLGDLEVALAERGIRLLISGDRVVTYDEAITPELLARVRELRDADKLPVPPRGPTPDELVDAVARFATA